MESRVPQAAVDPLFIERWSPRAFSPLPIAPATLASLFEAARWAPSSANEQPWFFLYAESEADLALFRPLLNESNQVWANRAPVLAFLFARKHGRRKPTEENRWAEFDSGAAWVSLALAARKIGLYTHAMAGFDEDRVYQELGVPRERYRAMAAIVIGQIGEPADLPPKVREREQPTQRRPLAEVAFAGKFPTGGAVSP